MSKQIGGESMRAIAYAGILCGLLAGLQSSAFGQDYRPTDSRYQSNYVPDQNFRATVPNLSEATAILESGVRNLYQKIEPGRETSPNELIAYADLRALRLYTGALEVAGWDLEQAAGVYNELNAAEARGNRGRRTSQIDYRRVDEARDRYMAFRETVRTLLFRVRQTAVSVEHQISFCDQRLAREWQRDVVPALTSTISATQPLFFSQDTYISYHIPGQAVPNVIQTGNSGIPSNAVEIVKLSAYQPYDGRGRGQGRYFEIRAYGGPVRVKSIRFRSHENAFGVLGTSIQRELTVDQVATPTQPLYIPCNRDKFVELSELEIEWESADSRRRTYGTIDVVADRPNQRN